MGRIMSEGWSLTQRSDPALDPSGYGLDPASDQVQRGGLLTGDLVWCWIPLTQARSWDESSSKDPFGSWDDTLLN